MSIHTELVAPPSQNGPALPQHPPGLNVPAVNQSPPAAQYTQYSSSYPVVNPAYTSAYNPTLPPAAYYQQQQPQQPQPQRNDPAQPQQHDQNGPLHDHASMMQEQFPDSELRYTQQIEQHQEHRDAPAEGSPPAAQALSAVSSPAKRKDKPSATASAATGSVASSDEGPPPAKRRRAATRSGIDNGDEDDVGPGGGAKHWSVVEKTRLFRWILEDDERWEQFGSKMNVIFREGSEKLFTSRKSFTALKSCYHRNLDVFKQIWLFEAFLARPPPAAAAAETAPGTPSSSTSAREVSDILHAPVPASFDTPQERQGFLDRKLDAARLLEVPIGNLTVKVIDNWYVRGWYTMFKRRFKEDPKTGLPVPSHDGLISNWSAIPPPLVRPPPEEDSGEHDDNDKDLPHSPTQQHAHPPQRPDDPSYALLTFPSTPKTVTSRVPLPSETPRIQHATPVSPSVRTTAINGNSNGHMHTPGSSRQRSQSQSQLRYPSSAHSSPHLAYVPPPPGPPTSSSSSEPTHPSTNGTFYVSPPPASYAVPPVPQSQAQFESQTLAALSHLTGVAQTLLGTCTTLTELVRAQVEDGRARTEVLRRKEEREQQSGAGGNVGDGAGGDEALGRTQKASLAMELLSNPGVDEGVKNVAADYLKKIFQ